MDPVDELRRHSYYKVCEIEFSSKFSFRVRVSDGGGDYIPVQLGRFGGRALRSIIHPMKFLTLVWIPWWLLLGLFEWGNTPHHTTQERGSVAVLVFGYGCVATLITVVYALTRVFRKASQDGAPRR